MIIICRLIDPTTSKWINLISIIAFGIGTVLLLLFIPRVENKVTANFYKDFNALHTAYNGCIRRRRIRGDEGKGLFSKPKDQQKQCNH